MDPVATHEEPLGTGLTIPSVNTVTLSPSRGGRRNSPRSRRRWMVRRCWERSCIAAVPRPRGHPRADGGSRSVGSVTRPTGAAAVPTRLDDLRDVTGRRSCSPSRRSSCWTSWRRSTSRRSGRRSSVSQPAPLPGSSTLAAAHAPGHRSRSRTHSDPASGIHRRQPPLPPPPLQRCHATHHPGQNQGSDSFRAK
jgi:hypothetical protein